MFERSRSLQIYMKPGIKEDDLMLKVWDACKKHERPQDVFRSMLRAGLLAMLETGEMPDSVIEECGLDRVLERRQRRKAPQQTQTAHPAFGYPHMGYPPHLPYPVAPPAPQQPASWPATEPQPIAAERMQEVRSEPKPAHGPKVDQRDRAEEPKAESPHQTAARDPQSSISPTAKKKGKIGNLM